jgi:hypothetical protein
MVKTKWISFCYMQMNAQILVGNADSRKAMWCGQRLASTIHRMKCLFGQSSLRPIAMNIWLGLPPLSLLKARPPRKAAPESSSLAADDKCRVGALVKMLTKRKRAGTMCDISGLDRRKGAHSPQLRLLCVGSSLCEVA